MTLMQKSRLYLQLHIVLIVAYNSRRDEMLAWVRGEVKKLKFIVGLNLKEVVYIKSTRKSWNIKSNNLKMWVSVYLDWSNIFFNSGLLNLRIVHGEQNHKLPQLFESHIYEECIKWKENKLVLGMISNMVLQEIV